LIHKACIAYRQQIGDRIQDQETDPAFNGFTATVNAAQAKSFELAISHKLELRQNHMTKV